MRIRGGIGVALPVAGGSSNAVKHAAKDDGKDDMSAGIVLMTSMVMIAMVFSQMLSCSFANIFKAF